MVEVIFWSGESVYSKERCIQLEKLLDRPAVHFETKGLTRHEIIEQLKNHEAALLLIDSVPLEKFDREELSKVAKTVIELDATKDPVNLPDNYHYFSSFTLHSENKEVPYGWDLFVPPVNLPTESNGAQKVCVHFGNGDEHNLSFRVLRHLVQLAVPLEIVICITPDYKWDVTALRLLALGRKSTTVKLLANPYEEMAKSSFIIGDGSYLTKISAFMEKPYIALSQNDEQFTQMMELETYGITHIGLGRKVKQSHLQNALMELYLHPKKAAKQIELLARWKACHNNIPLVQFATKHLSVLK